MRLWSIHPEYLDTKGLVALWREGLLAQKVLLGKTKGYRNHPQLIRFRRSNDPLGAIAGFLRPVMEEALRRHYSFDGAKIIPNSTNTNIWVQKGQVEYEFEHLLRKLKERDPGLYEKIKNTQRIRLHPLFRGKSGGVEAWEVVK